MNRSFLDNIMISLYQPGVFLYNKKIEIFIAFSVLLIVFISLAIVLRKKAIFPLYTVLAVIMGLFLIGEIVHV